MSINTALEQLLEVEQIRKESAYSEETLVIGMSRLGAPDQQIVAGPMGQLLEHDFGPPLHCLVIAGGCARFCSRSALSKRVEQWCPCFVQDMQHMQQGEAQQHQHQQL
jgi:diphthine synthase